MLSGLKVFHRGLILVAVPFVLELALIIGLGLLLYQSDQEQLKEAKYRKIAAVNARLIMLTSEVPYYLINGIRFSSPEIFRIYENKRKQVLFNQKKLFALLKTTTDLADGADEIQSSIDEVIAITDEIAAAKDARLPDLLSKLPKVTRTFDEQKGKILERLAKMLRAGEIRTGEIQKQQQIIRYRQSQILLIGIAANLLAAVILAIFFRRTVASRLRTIKQNTILLSKNETLQAPLTGGDEIAQLDQAFHAMDEELRLAARREKELFDNASDVICVLDYNNRFVKVNLASQRIWGYSPDELTSMTAEQLVHKDDMNAMLDHIARGKLNAESFNFENRIIRADGEQIEVSWSTFWSQIDRQLYCVVHDITERKRTERKKQKFLAMISSDLKSPLSAMSAAVAILLGSLAETLPATARDKLQIAGKNLQRLLGLVNDLLQVTEMENSSIDIKKELCDTEEPLMRSIQEVEALADKRGIKLQLQSCQVQWYVDSDRIVQVLVNLLSNAIKFSPDGGTVTLSAVEQGDMIEVRVDDQGRGVPESHREAIFEKFKQVEAADGKRKSGTGLGLPICKQIVEDHGGSIGVRDADGPGTGSRFWFLVPKDESVSLSIKLKKRKQQEAEEQTKKEIAALSLQQGEELPATRRKGKFSGNMKLGYKGAILVGVPLLFELLLVGCMSTILVQVDNERKQELHYRNIAFQTTKVINMYFMMIVGAIDHNSEKDWVLFEQGYRTSKESLAQLARIVKSDPAGRKYVELARIQSRALDEFFDHARKLVEEGNFKAAMGGKEKMAPSVIKSGHQLERLCEDSEKKELTSPERQKKLRTQQYLILFLALAANIASALALAVFFSSDIVSRLQILADNAMRLAKEMPLNKELSGSDEISDLDRTFHSTARALSEARKKERAVFDNSQDLICSLNQEAAFRSANPAAESILGYTNIELSKMTLADIVLPEDAELAKTLFDIKQGEHLQLELRVKRNDQSMAYSQWSYSRGQEHGDVLCVVHDISNLKELEQIKQEFLAMVSHDLRTPLTSVLGITKLITASAFGAVEERPNRILNSISKHGEQLLELINDLLDIEKLEAGKMQLVLEEFQLTDLLNKAVSQSRDSKRVEIENKNDNPVLLKADLDRMAQAIANLLNHSIDRSPADSRVRLHSKLIENELHLEIIDEAPALSELAAKQLFDRFQSLDSAEATESSSKGLGLPIAKKIIESHGGTIGARNDEGTTIWIRLPQQQI